MTGRASFTDYRSDIDGLRAIAVLSVVLFHLEVSALSGGFVGVDIFFVISGFLITRIIVGGLESGNFTFANFYERRARRILPGLVLMLSAATVAAYFLFMPEEMAEYGLSLAGSLGFVSNIYFWTEVDYFDLPASHKPLLHTWSLGIEEQFYLLFPVLLWLAHRRLGVQRMLACITIISAGSLVYSVLATKTSPAAAFYLLPSRGWELLLGSILAYRPCQAMSRPAAEVLAGAGLSLVLVSVFLIDETSEFPGIGAIPPCLGAAALILTGGLHKTFVSRLLGSPVMVWFGLISYSLYLWHWPIIVYAKYYAMRDLQANETAIAFIAAIVISAISWKFVEQPSRQRHAFQNGQTLLIVSGVVSLLGILLGAVIAVSGGLPYRVPPEVHLALDKEKYLHPYRHCHNRTVERLELHDVCRIGAAQTEPSFIVWGDSHADMMTPSIAVAAQNSGRSGVVFTMGGCAPELGTWSARARNRDCERRQQVVANYLNANPGITDVILAGFWRRQAEGLSNEGGGRFRIDERSIEVGRSETLRVFRRGLERIIKRWPDRNFYLIADIPEIGFSPPNLLARRLFMGKDSNLNQFSIPWQEVAARQKASFDILTSLAQAPNALFIGVADILCSQSTFNQKTRANQRFCPISKSGQLIYRNGDHLSKFGAALLTQRFRTMFAGRRQGVSHPQGQLSKN